MTFIDIFRADACTRHLVEDRERELTTGNTWRWVAHTACGREVRGSNSGQCIAPLIDCRSCRAALRARGWDV